MKNSICVSFSNSPYSQLLTRVDFRPHDVRWQMFAIRTGHYSHKIVGVVTGSLNVYPEDLFSNFSDLDLFFSVS